MCAAHQQVPFLSQDPASARPSAVQRALDDRSSGRPLDSPLREELGSGFSEVRVHADHTAATLAAGVGADAFTRGTDIYFGAGRYQPKSLAGAELLRHEITHVVQQARGEVSGFAGRVVPPGHPSEADARSHPALGRRAPAPGAQNSSIQRQAVQRQLSGPVRTAANAPPASKSLPKNGAEKVYDALVDKWWSLSTTKRNMYHERFKGSCAAFILMIAERPVLYPYTLMREIHRDLGIGYDQPGLDQFKSHYGVAIDRFATDIGRQLLHDVQLTSDPLQTWQWAQQEFSEFLSDGGRGSAFNDRVEDAILGDFKEKAAKELKRKPAELQEMADSEVKLIIHQFAENIIDGVTQAGASWYLPMPVGTHNPSITKAGAATTLWATEVGEMFFKHGGKLLKLGLHILPFATFALELISIFKEASEEEERIRKENKRLELEGRARDGLYRAWNRTVTGIEARSDVLSVLVVAEALKRKINPKAAGKHRLEILVIEHLGFDPDVYDRTKVLEKASWELHDKTSELQQEMEE